MASQPPKTPKASRPKQKQPAKNQSRPLPNLKPRQKATFVAANPSWAKKRSPNTLDEDRDYGQVCDNAMAQFIDPPRLLEAVLAPDGAPNQRCSRRFVSRFKISSSDAGCASGFTLVVAPSLKAPITYSGPDALLPAGAPGPLAVDGHFDATAGNVIGDNAFVANDSSDNKATMRLQNSMGWAIVGSALPGLAIKNVAAPAAQDVTIIFSDGGSNTKLGTRVILYRAAVGDVGWTQVGTYPISSSSEPAVVSIGTTAFDFLGFAVTSSGAHSHRIHFKLSTTGAGLAQATVVAARDLGRGQVLASLQDANGGRLVGMSVLVSNTSAQLGNGGTLTAARVPHNVSPFADVAAINSRCPQHDFYQGPARTGAYVWWLPREESTQTFMDLDEAEEQLARDAYLFVNLDGWGGDNVSSVQVTVHYVVEFYMGSQLFEKLIPPPRLPMWDAYMHALAQVPAASCNPSHIELFKQGLAKARSFIEGATSHYRRHQAIYDAAFQALAKMAA